MKHGWLEHLLVVLFGAAVGWFYLWTVESGMGPIRFGDKQTDYYNLLIDGWRAGQLHLKVEAPAELLALKDPHDPAQRPPNLGLHDVSLFKGKYYLYFGVVPAAVVMLPFRLVTEIDLPMSAAVLVFTFGGFIASVAAWRMIRRRFFPDASTGMMLTAMVTLGLAGLEPVLVRRPLFWELPIAGGYCFAMLGLCGVLRALEDERRAGRWLVVAGVCLGLAIGSRITYLMTTPLLLAPLVWLWRQRGTFPWREALGVTAPLVFVGALLAWHNYARFGDPLEFGLQYQLNSRDETHMTHFAGRYVPFNAWVYFWGPAQWISYFPFLTSVALPVGPEGHGGVENVYGILTNLPIAWFTVAVPLALRRRESSERAALTAGLAAITALFIANATLLVFFFAAHGRYMLDFTPALMLLACVGGLAIEREARQLQARWWRWSASAVWAGTAIFSAGFAILFSLTLMDIFPKNSPRTYRALSEWLNQIVAGFERAAGVRHGPIELTMRLPSAGGRPGERQALLLVGEAPQRNTVFVQFGDRGQIQLGFAQEGGGSQLSRPLPIDATQPHRVRVALGSFWPPDTHPLFRGMAAGDIARLRRSVEIAVDDEVVLEQQARFSGLTPTAVRIAPHLDDNALGHRFLGEVLKVKRDSALEVTTIASADCVRLRMALPTIDAEQSLVTIGIAEHGARLLVRRAGNGSAQFIWCVAGAAPLSSALLPLENKEAHEVLIKLTRPSAAESDAKGALHVVLDDVLVWSCRVTVPGVNEAMHVESSVGTIFSQERFTDGADPILTGRGAVHLTLRFPRVPSGGVREPLVVTGRSGEGDFLFVEYDDDGRLRFGFDHWGESRRMISEAVAVDRTATHEIEVALGSLPRENPARGDSRRRSDPARVLLDGVLVFEVDTSFYRPGPGEIYVGRNPIGGSSCGPVFSGDIMRAVREVPPDN